VRAAASGALALLLAGGTASAEPFAATDYALQCQGCHGADGAGVAGRVPPLGGVAALLATSEGRARLLAVPGVRQASVSDERLAALLAWVALRFAPPGAAPAFAPLTAEEVGRLRRTAAATF
jgi:mono/diheme cytochrome c family protein